MTLEFRSLPGLWHEYAGGRSLAFQAATLVEAQDWQKQLRQQLFVLLGLTPEQGYDFSSPAPLAQPLESFAGDGFHCEHIAIQTQAGEYMPCYVLTPDHPQSQPLKPVIALHGHGTWGAEGIVHAPDDPLGAALTRQLNYDYAGQLARHGYLVFAPELRGFGSRLENPEYRQAEDPQWISSCFPVAVNALLLGKTLLGMRIYDVMRLIDYINTLPGVPTHSLGCVGLSGGGMATLFTTALDTRITCAVVSGYFNTFRHSIMSIRHCICNFAPGLARLAEMADIAGLVAPRPLLIESGLRDPIFPVEATRLAYVRLQQIYAVFGVDAPGLDHPCPRLDIDIFDGEHAWSGAKAFDWLACNL